MEWASIAEDFFLRRTKRAINASREDTLAREYRHDVQDGQSERVSSVEKDEPIDWANIGDRFLTMVEDEQREEQKMSTFLPLPHRKSLGKLRGPAPFDAHIRSPVYMRINGSVLANKSRRPLTLGGPRHRLSQNKQSLHQESTSRHLGVCPQSSVPRKGRHTTREAPKTRFPGGISVSLSARNPVIQKEHTAQLLSDVSTAAKSSLPPSPSVAEANDDLDALCGVGKIGNAVHVNEGPKIKQERRDEERGKACARSRSAPARSYASHGFIEPRSCRDTDDTGTREYGTTRMCYKRITLAERERRRSASKKLSLLGCFNNDAMTRRRVWSSGGWYSDRHVPPRHRASVSVGYRPNTRYPSAVFTCHRATRNEFGGGCRRERRRGQWNDRGSETVDVGGIEAVDASGSGLFRGEFASESFSQTQLNDAALVCNGTISQKRRPLDKWGGDKSAAIPRGHISDHISDHASGSDGIHIPRAGQFSELDKALSVDGRLEKENISSFFLQHDALPAVLHAPPSPSVSYPESMPPLEAPVLPLDTPLLTKEPPPSFPDGSTHLRVEAARGATASGYRARDDIRAPNIFPQSRNDISMSAPPKGRRLPTGDWACTSTVGEPSPPCTADRAKVLQSRSEERVTGGGRSTGCHEHAGKGTAATTSCPLAHYKSRMSNWFFTSLPLHQSRCPSSGPRASRRAPLSWGDLSPRRRNCFLTSSTSSERSLNVLHPDQLHVYNGVEHDLIPAQRRSSATKSLKTCGRHGSATNGAETVQRRGFATNRVNAVRRHDSAITDAEKARRCWSAANGLDSVGHSGSTPNSGDSTRRYGLATNGAEAAQRYGSTTNGCQAKAACMKQKRVLPPTPNFSTLDDERLALLWPERPAWARQVAIGEAPLRDDGRKSSKATALTERWDTEERIRPIDQGEASQHDDGRKLLTQMELREPWKAEERINPIEQRAHASKLAPHWPSELLEQAGLIDHDRSTLKQRDNYNTADDVSSIVRRSSREPQASTQEQTLYDSTAALGTPMSNEDYDSPVKGACEQPADVELLREKPKNRQVPLEMLREVAETIGFSVENMVSALGESGDDVEEDVNAVAPKTGITPPREATTGFAASQGGGEYDNIEAPSAFSSIDGDAGELFTNERTGSVGTTRSAPNSAPTAAVRTSTNVGTLAIHSRIASLALNARFPNLPTCDYARARSRLSLRDWTNLVEAPGAEDCLWLHGTFNSEMSDFGHGEEMSIAPGGGKQRTFKTFQWLTPPPTLNVIPMDCSALIDEVTMRVVDGRLCLAEQHGFVTLCFRPV